MTPVAIPETGSVELAQQLGGAVSNHGAEFVVETLVIVDDANEFFSCKGTDVTGQVEKVR